MYRRVWWVFSFAHPRMLHFCRSRSRSTNSVRNLLNKLCMLLFALTQIPFIQTTGLADPAPVAQTFFVDETIKAGARLDAIVTVVDAVSICPQIKYLYVVCECTRYKRRLVFIAWGLVYQGVYTGPKSCLYWRQRSYNFFCIVNASGYSIFLCIFGSSLYAFLIFVIRLYLEFQYTHCYQMATRCIWCSIWTTKSLKGPKTKPKNSCSLLIRSSFQKCNDLSLLPVLYTSFAIFEAKLFMLSFALILLGACACVVRFCSTRSTSWMMQRP